MCGTTTYASGTEAGRARQALSADHRLPKGVDVYRCHTCGLWHLGRDKHGHAHRARMVRERRPKEWRRTVEWA